MVAPRTFTPEMIENGRYRYEETDEPVASIAADFGFHERSFRRWAKKRGWRGRADRPPVGLPKDLELSLKADRALREAAGLGAGGGEGAASVLARPTTNETPTPNPSPQGGGEQAAASGEGAESHQGVESAVSVAEELEREVAEQLGDVKRLRAQSGPLPPADAERTARTLERLTDTLTKVQRLRSGGAGAAMLDDYDDIPSDIDEFREALARRIEAFVRSRTDLDVPPGGGACDPASA